MTEPMSTDLVYASASLEERKEYAQAIARAGDLLPKGLLEEAHDDNGRTYMRPSPGKVLLIAETGNMLGIHPIAALNGVNVIEGKPTISPALMSALVRRAGHKLRVTTSGTVEGGDFQASATLIRADDPHHPYVSTWTPHRAVRAGLCQYTQKDGVWTVRARSKYDKVLPWEAYTEALCKARAIGEACRDGAEDALMGVHYTAEELGAAVNDQGEVIDGEIVEDEPETGTPGDTVKTKARLRDPAATGPVAEPTRTGANRPGPSRPVTSPGTGRASGEVYPPEQNRGKAGNTPDVDRHAVADEWATRARSALTLTDARTLYREAHQRGILDYPLSSGELLEDVLRARGEQLADEEAHAAAEDLPPALDGIEDDA